MELRLVTTRQLTSPLDSEIQAGLAYCCSAGVSGKVSLFSQMQGVSGRRMHNYAAGGVSMNVAEHLSNLEDLKRKLLISEAEYQSSVQSFLQWYEPAQSKTDI